jgi:predicted secreted protein
LLVSKDLNSKLSELNADLQDENQIAIKMNGTIDSIREEMKLWKTKLTKGVLTQFLGLQSQADGKFGASVYILCINKLSREPEGRFKDSKRMKLALSFVINPFQEWDISEDVELI